MFCEKFSMSHIAKHGNEFFFKHNDRVTLRKHFTFNIKLFVMKSIDKNIKSIWKFCTIDTYGIYNISQVSKVYILYKYMMYNCINFPEVYSCMHL